MLGEIGIVQRSGNLTHTAYALLTDAHRACAQRLAAAEREQHAKERAVGNVEGDDIYGDGVNIAARLEAPAADHHCDDGPRHMNNGERDPQAGRVPSLGERTNEKPFYPGCRGLFRGGLRREDVWITSKLWNDKHGDGDVIGMTRHAIGPEGQHRVGAPDHLAVAEVHTVELADRDMARPYRVPVSSHPDYHGRARDRTGSTLAWPARGRCSNIRTSASTTPCCRPPCRRRSRWPGRTSVTASRAARRSSGWPPRPCT